MSGEWELPDPGQGRRWRISKERSRSWSGFDPDSRENYRPWGYEVFLEQYIPSRVVIKKEEISPPWYMFWSNNRTFKDIEVDVPEKWFTVYVKYVPDLIDKNLVATANLILEIVAVSDVTKRLEASRLGTYPPLKLSDAVDTDAGVV